MKLTAVKIQNFRSMKSADFSFPETGFVVSGGANNAGESIIAITLVRRRQEFWVPWNLIGRVK
jgi:predicted ATP-dependent endonuclease of OLD family